MKLTTIMPPECVIVPLVAADKSEAICRLVQAIAHTDRCTDEHEILQAIFDREALASTGIGRGLAVPHGKSKSCRSLVMALGKPRDPIPWDSIDGRPADLVVLLASPKDQTGPHIQALAQISRLMLMDPFRVALTEATTPERVYAIIREYES